jgi:hypothetical protein
MRKLVYITSPSYSGSTLLTFLLAGHESIATVGELKATAMGRIDCYRCSCGSFIRECGFWKAVSEELGRQGVVFDVSSFGTHFEPPAGHGLSRRLFTARVRGGLVEGVRDLGIRAVPGLRRRLEAVVERNRALIEAVCTIRGAECFLDGSKDPVRLKFLLAAGLWDVKVVHLTRDGRGACNSFMRVYSAGMAEAALEWRRTNEECERLMEALPSSSGLRLRYEDLCADPEASLSSIYGLVGVGCPERREDFKSIEHHILGNAMRLRPEGRIRQDEKWRSSLSRRDLDTFDEVAGELNRRYGYTAA